MPNLECHICGSTNDVKWAEWFGEEVPLCYECREDFGLDDDGRFINRKEESKDFEYDDYVPLR